MATAFAMGLYSLTMSISPGPVNMITLSSGIRYGFKKTFPFVSGATLGFIFLLSIVGLGVYNLVGQFSLFYTLLKYVGAAFIIYMGYKTIRSQSEIEAHEGKRPSFTEGFLMQFLNPKAWIAAVSGVSLFNSGDSPGALILFVLIYFIVCYMSVSVWALLGSKLKLVLKSKRSVRAINTMMGSALIVIAVYLAVQS